MQAVAWKTNNIKMLTVLIDHWNYSLCIEFYVVCVLLECVVDSEYAVLGEHKTWHNRMSNFVTHCIYIDL